MINAGVSQDDREDRQGKPVQAGGSWKTYWVKWEVISRGKSTMMVLVDRWGRETERCLGTVRICYGGCLWEKLGSLGR